MSHHIFECLSRHKKGFSSFHLTPVFHWTMSRVHDLLHTTLNHTTLPDTSQLFSTSLHTTLLWQCFITHDMTWYDMIWHDMIWHDMTWHDMTWYYMICHNMTWDNITCHNTWHDITWQGNFSGAENLYQQCIDYNPCDGRAWLGLARIYWKRGQALK